MKTNKLFQSHSSSSAGSALNGLRFAALGLALLLPASLHAVSAKFTSSGSFTPPAGITSITVEVWGGGGAGGSAQKITGATGNAGAGGGGGGAYAKKINIPVTPGTPYTVTIPAAAVAPASGFTNTEQSASGANVTFTGDAGVSVTANGGTGVWAYGIDEITDAQGQSLYKRQGDGPGRVMEFSDVALMNSMLSGVVEHGTGTAAAIGRPVAGKTGTSSDFRDAWFMGYSNELVGGVWLGNDDGHVMKRVTGGGLPARLWQRIMVKAHQGFPVQPLVGTTPRGAATPAPQAQAIPTTTQQPQQELGFWDRLKDTLGIR